MSELAWQPWRDFPDPAKGEYLIAPYGAGVYWLRLKTGEDIYIGEGGHVCERMTSLLPKNEGGRGTRDNEALRKFVRVNLGSLEYTTAACPDKRAARALEGVLHRKHPCMFS